MHRSAFLVLLVATACGPDDAARQSSPAKSSVPEPDTRSLVRLDMPWAPSVDLLLTQSTEGVTVVDAVVADNWLDIDASVGREEAFRTRLIDADGHELHRRSTPTPVLVRDYLAHYSERIGFQLIDGIPELGAFHITIPLLEGAEEAIFEIRDAEGTYVEVGHYDLGLLPDGASEIPEAVTGWTTLRSSVSSEAALDITLVADGFTEDEQELWVERADQLAAALVEIAPLSGMAERINIHRLDAMSAESGASYDCVDECRFRETAFSSVFAINFVNDITGTDYRSSAIFQLDQHGLDKALAVVPTDLAIVVSNTEVFGGMALHHATVTPAEPDHWVNVGVHEFGHLLGMLGDEYTVDDCIVSESMGLPPNITDSASAPRWSHWVDAETPLPTPEDAGYDDVVGAFERAYNCDDLYRPVDECMMRSSGADFCAVCSEQLVLQVTRYADIALPVITEDDHAGTIDLDTAGFEVSVRRSADGLSWSDTTLPVQLSRDDDEVWLEVTVLTDHVRVHNGEMVELLHFGWE